ncbi:DUF1553 domain-containing protein [Calycomorphotria hydatis]|uniref:Planctomycete cytochrome C n=1 Tax=Calycomorphotria hydatis TaxID=2528027 RepID=A0A517T9U7_9PLAN|nr:DUF1553 domain-containing protein [Calycomorphotria hydatis]QDT65148.1 Planctomycete cytochrome C [Calycomorphotria hydatis]
MNIKFKHFNYSHALFIGGHCFLFLLIMSSCPLHAGDVNPIAHWGFGQEESSRLEPHGGVHRDVPGPRPELYPDFAVNNTAVRLDGKGARYTYADPGINSPFDFTNGDGITMEAWVKIDQIYEGENVYIIGKGRTGNPGFGTNNQNWALRVRQLRGQSCISLLFSAIAPESSTTDAKAKDVSWHRWTSNLGFTPGEGWHHIAIAYRFGEPDSILGVIDGKQVTGKWDADGPTRNTPTVDNDAIWIGSALGGSPSNSFRGDLDEISIYRKALPLKTLQSRYNGPGVSMSSVQVVEEMPELGDLPLNTVQLTYHEGMPSHTRWLFVGERVPAETMRWQSAAFLIDRLPQIYDSWGIRNNWKGPVLMRMAADVSLPRGNHRALMRVRGLSRLWINGKLIATGKPKTGGIHGFEPMTPPGLAPKLGLRIAEHRQQEVFGNFEVGSEDKTRVVLETLVGGGRFRTEPGETCVAIETADGNSFVLLQPEREREIHLTDQEVKSFLASQEFELRQFDDQRRRAAAQTQDAFWSHRHNYAAKWAKEHPAPEVPNQQKGQHPIEAFLDAKIQAALASSSQIPLQEVKQFHEEVLPILSENCFRCHGEKTQGGLVINSLDTARAGGDSGLPAIEPGDIENSEMIRRIHADSPEERMPPGEAVLSSKQITILEEWINRGANWPALPISPEEITKTPITSDHAFLRRVYLDTVGVIPTDAEAQEFLNDSSPDKRTRLIDRLLSDERWADHWTSYWQDLLAENPVLLNKSLNATGPFRWYIYDSFRDNKSFDRFVTELVLLRGSIHEGGSAGFGIAANNDAPLAAKGQIVSRAFLGIELQCARCHDSPYHSTTQQDLYSLAAMFKKQAVTVPSTSRVPAKFFEKQQRTSLIQVTLPLGEPVQPVWPFASLTEGIGEDSLKQLTRNSGDTREKLAALITSPQNQRFAEVTVNRVWRRLIGTGIVEPPDDWEGKKPSHPELLKWLAREFIAHQYDLKYVARLILTSDLYQRKGVQNALPKSPEKQFFIAPDRRRMTAEQIIDSLHEAVGKSMDVEELTFDPDAGFDSRRRINLGKPERAWMFSSLGNERDRPSLSLPKLRALADIMEAFGWQGARQNPRTDRDGDPNVLQPGVIQNSDAAVVLSRASHQSGLADAAVNAATPGQLIDTLFLKVLSRLPNEEERNLLTSLLDDGFNDRLLPDEEQEGVQPLEPLPRVTWSNHVQPEANTIAVELEQRARTGPPVDPRLREDWRKRYEDVVWSLINLSEFVWVP